MNFYSHDYYFNFFQFKKYANSAGKPFNKAFPEFFDSLASEQLVDKACLFLTEFSTALEQKSGKPFGKMLKIEGLNDPHHQNGNRDTSLLKNARLYYEWQEKLGDLYVELAVVAENFRNTQFLYADQYNKAIEAAERDALLIIRKVFPLHCIGDSLFREADSVTPTLKIAHDHILRSLDHQESKISRYRNDEYHENQRRILEQNTKMAEYDWIHNSNGLTVGQLKKTLANLSDNMRVLIKIDPDEGQYIEDVELRQHASPHIETFEDLYITIRNN